MLELRRRDKNGVQLTLMQSTLVSTMKMRKVITIYVCLDLDLMCSCSQCSCSLTFVYLCINMTLNFDRCG